MKKELIIQIFSELSNIYASIGDTFRALAYSKAILSLKKDSSENIGKSIQAKIDEINRTGKLKLLEDFKANNIVQQRQILRKIHGFSNAFLNKYAITSIEDLQNKIKNGKIKLTSGQSLGIKYYKSLLEKIPREEIGQIGGFIKSKLKSVKGIKSIEVVGSYRRGKVSAKDIDIMIIIKNEKNKSVPRMVMSKLKECCLLGTFASGARKFNGVIKSPISGEPRHLDIMYAYPIEYPTSLLAFTGSAGFNRLLRARAIEMGWKLSEKGLYDGSNKRIGGIKNEKDIFKKLKFNYIKPEGRSI